MLNITYVVYHILHMIYFLVWLLECIYRLQTRIFIHWSNSLTAPSRSPRITLLFLVCIFLELQKLMIWSKERLGSSFLSGYIEIKISLLDLFRGSVS